uniref:Uncharacterized protein n=1 Tax=Oryza punctata TaxID=4537 RepID=A0A0E0LST7_ORYPU
METEEDQHGTLLRRVLTRAARAVARVSATTAPSPSSPAPAAPRLSRTPSLLDCMDDDGESSSFFYTPASSPVVGAEVVDHYPRRMQQPSLIPSPAVAAAADIDRRAAEFIEKFRRNVSLELRYCAVHSPLMTPVKPPMSPDTYFKLSRVHHGAVAGDSPSPAAYVRKMSSLMPSRRSDMSIKWPTAGTGRPTVEALIDVPSQGVFSQCHLAPFIIDGNRQSTAGRHQPSLLPFITYPRSS